MEFGKTRHFHADAATQRTKHGEEQPDDPQSGIREHHHEHSENCQHDHQEQPTPKKIPIAQIQPTVAIIYTCKRCDTRSSQQFARLSYEEGTVIVRCPGCKVLHLIADNKGIFTDERSNIFDYLREKGHENVDAAIKRPEELETLLQKEGVEIAKLFGMSPNEGTDAASEGPEEQLHHKHEATKSQE